MRTRTGIPVLSFDRIDSTNAEARRMADKGERGPLWIVAGEQTGGRGRLGRSWVSEPGNLYATRLFATEAPPQAAAQVSFVAAVAVQQAVTRLLPALDVRIKWPNDLLIKGAKFCGLLPEVVAQSPVTIALGCGINIAHAPEGTPYPVTCLGAPATVAAVLEELDSSLSKHLEIWKDGRGFPAIRAAWSTHAIGLGDVCRSDKGEGIFRGLADDGALILEDADGARMLIHSGEVRFAALEALRQS